jgi:hypothetical protein
MPFPILAQINSVNQSLFHLLEQTRRALAGEAHFDAGTVRELSLLVAEMDPILPRSKQLRAAHPELCAPLDHYLRLASNLRTELDKIQVMLLARRASLEAARTQLHAASQFVNTLSSTTR